jgi:uncharacterized protein with ATP-grasp and redox domains
VIARKSISKVTERDLLLLKKELLNGVIKDLFEGEFVWDGAFEQEELSVWKEQVALYEGRPWGSVPWYFAETLFYIRFLVDFGYFDRNSSMYGVDPFQPEKNEELFSKSGCLSNAERVTGLLERTESLSERILLLLFCSLWGNRIDLSNKSIAEGAWNRILERGEKNILIDHSERLTELLWGAQRVDIVTDNCGTELGCDLLLAENLLKMPGLRAVHFHLKKHPVFVSDAMVKDMQKTLDALSCEKDGKVSALGNSLLSYGKEGRLFLHDHWFWNSPLFYTDFPKSLETELSKSDLVILKGDVNYRRLLSDRRWPHSEKMEEIAGQFPASFAVLRTLKSEIIVDLDEKTVKALDRVDPRWMLNGERGVIRLVEIPGNR